MSAYDLLSKDDIINMLLIEKDKAITEIWSLFRLNEEYFPNFEITSYSFSEEDSENMKSYATQKTMLTLTKKLKIIDLLIKEKGYLYV